MEFGMTLLSVTVLMTIHSAVCCSKQTCPMSITSCEAEEMKDQLEEAIDLASRVAEALKNAKRKACSLHPEDCEAIYKCGHTSSGVYTVWPRNRILTTIRSIQVYCDMDTDGGGWTVIQRRGDFGRPKDYFYRNWESYKEGFGDITQDFWMGNDLIFALTNQKSCTLRFDLRDVEGNSRWAKYDAFWIESEEYNYTLKVQGYSGNAGDSLSAHNRRQFTTKDRDNDRASGGNCAEWFRGAWWYFDCHVSNLNGLYLNGSHSSYADGIEWTSWLGYQYSLPFTEMKIRSIFFI